MKVSRQKIEAQSNLNGSGKKFGIANPALIMHILRNSFYSDKIATPVKEILCNARDAHREIKNAQERVQVTLPTQAVPVLKIRDFGPGLSKQRINEVFRFYGNTTKTNDDGQTGGFGLGAKSPFAYTDSFIVISFHEGVETHYVSHLGNSEEGQLDVSYEGKTTKPNGVEVQIPVLKEQDLRRFWMAVYRATYLWEENERPHVLNEAEVRAKKEIPEGLLNPNPLYNSKSVVVLGSKDHKQDDVAQVLVDGIPYNLPRNDLFEHAFKAINAFSGYNNLKVSYILKFKNHEITISPNREAITLTELSVESVLSRLKEALKDIETSAHEDFEKARFEDLQALVDKYRSFYNVSNFPQHKDGFKLYIVAGARVRILDKAFFSLRLVEPVSGQRLVSISDISFLYYNKIYSYDKLSQASVINRLNALYQKGKLDPQISLLVLRTPEVVKFLKKRAHIDLNQMPEPVSLGETPVTFFVLEGNVEKKQTMKLNELLNFKKIFLYPVAGFAKKECSVEGHFITRAELVEAARYLLPEKVYFIRPENKKAMEELLSLPNAQRLAHFKEVMNQSEMITFKARILNLPWEFSEYSSGDQLDGLENFVSSIEDPEVKSYLDLRIQAKNSIAQSATLGARLAPLLFVLAFEKLSAQKAAAQNVGLALSSLAESIRKRYPLLNFIHDLDDSEVQKATVDYLNLVYRGAK